MKYTVIVVAFIIGYMVISYFFQSKKTSTRQQHENGGRAFEKNRPSFDGKEWYEVLGIPEHSAMDQIKGAYRKQIAAYHPDKVATLGDDLKELSRKRSQEINAAFEYAVQMKKSK
jgi:DnaJ like chaperone protein